MMVQPAVRGLARVVASDTDALADRDDALEEEVRFITFV